MKKLVVFIVSLYIGCYGHAQQVITKIDSILTTYQSLYKFNGAVLVAKNGTVLLNKGYGYRNAAGHVPNDEQTIFQLGSITKQFTAAIILKLQQEKKLNVQDKLSKYFPDYPKGDSITIENLLLHTSGIFNYTNDQKFMAEKVTIPASREEIMTLFKINHLIFLPAQVGITLIAAIHY